MSTYKNGQLASGFNRGYPPLLVLITKPNSSIKAPYLEDTILSPYNLSHTPLRDSAHARQPDL
jgi:hypothetical protein